MMYYQPLKTLVGCRTSLEEQQAPSHHLEEVADCSNSSYSVDSPSAAHNYSTGEEVDQFRTEKTSCHHKAWDYSHQMHFVLQTPLLLVVALGHFVGPWCMFDRKLQETKDQGLALATEFLGPYLLKKT
jgi:hypothetical protein